MHDQLIRLDNFLNGYEKSSHGIFCSKEKAAGYWSNLDKRENDELIKGLDAYPSAKEALINKHPQYYDIIFSPKREAGLELLELKGDEACIDYGCMWGALTIPLAKRVGFVLGVDQTLQSLILLKKRISDEKLTNVDLLCEDLNKMPAVKEKFDIAIINGVLEWIPETGEIELKKYYGKKSRKRYSASPKDMQIAFLRKAHASLKENGKLYLAIENRHDFKMFMGLKDPHANLMFTSILPRWLANFVSIARLGRPYINWTYSFTGTRDILKRAGFKSMELYCCFPDYHFPEFISRYDQRLEGFNPTVPLRNDDGKVVPRRLARVAAELFLFRYLKAKSVAPAIIAIARK